MNSNNSFREIGDELNRAESVLIYPHVNMDGDALGSAAAMCRALRKLGKEAYILIEDDIPSNIKFLDKGYCTYDKNVIENPDISLCLDCGDIGRFLNRKDKFLEGKTTICIDHHSTTKPFCNFNYIDPAAAATGELIFLLLEEMGVEGDKEMGDAIFSAITTDTGNYQYSNTTAQSHLITAKLYDWGTDMSSASVEIYDNVRLEKILIKSKAMETLELICDGQAAVAYVSQEMLKETGASMDETEGIVEQLRSISGVEIAVFAKEHDEETTKLSMRAKSWGNVAEIAQRIGGGGHIKAAGATMKMPISQAMEIIKEEVKKSFI